MKFKDLPAEKKYEMYQAFQRGEINNLEDLDKFYPKEAPKGFQTIDTGLSKVADFANAGIEKAKQNPILANRIQRWGDILKLGSLPAQALGSGANSLMDVAGIPKGPEMADLLPKTSQATGVNPNARDLLPLLAVEGLGRGGAALKGYGERGTVNAFERGKPALPPAASKEMVADILDKNYLPHQEAASDVITNAMLGLKEKGLEASQEARNISDQSGIPISRERLLQLNEHLPEHPEVQKMMSQIDPAKAYINEGTPAQTVTPESLYDIFSYGNKNRSRMWKRDPINPNQMAVDPSFGRMMSGLRSDLRGISDPLNSSQMDMVNNLAPGFEGTTVGEAVHHLNDTTSSAIHDQKFLNTPSIDKTPLGFMEGVYSNPDKRSFAQRLSRDSGYNELLDFADKYGSSKDYAKDLSSYMDKGVSGPGFNPDKFAKHAMYGGVPLALANEAGKLVGSPIRRYEASKALGGFAEKLKPSNLLKMEEGE